MTYKPLFLKNWWIDMASIIMTSITKLTKLSILVKIGEKNKMKIIDAMLIKWAKNPELSFISWFLTITSRQCDLEWHMCQII